MKIRHGVCSDCGAQYKIPVSFSANRAKCKQCGGVVEIGPPVDDSDAGAPAKKAEAKAAAPAKKAAPPMPAKKVRPAVEKPAAVKQQGKKAEPKKPAAKAPAKNVAKKAAKPAAKKAAPAKPAQKAAAKKPAPKPKAPAAKAAQTPVDDALVEIRGSGKKKGGMSMKERLLAERAAAAKSQATPAAAKKPAAKKAAPARAAAAAGAARAGSRAAAPAARKSSSRSGARAGQRRGGRRGEVDEDEEIAGASRRSGGRRGRPQQSKVPMLVGLGLMAAAGVGGFLYVQNQKTVKAAADEEVANQDPATVTNEETNDPASTEIIDEATGNAMIGDSADSADETPAEPAATDAAPEETTPAAPEGGDKKPAMEKPKPAKDPASIDLTVYDFERAEGTTDEEWADILADVETAIDLDAGAAGTRALTRLRETGRKAFPAVLNAMHDLDYSTQDGVDNGDVLQKCLREILAGLSFNWFYTTEPDDVWKNKKAVQRWSNEWSKVVDDPAYWDKISAKATRKEKERESEPDPLGEELEADLDDLDDLEDL